MYPGMSRAEPQRRARPVFHYRPGAIEIIVFVNCLVYGLFGFPTEPVSQSTLLRWGAEWGPLSLDGEWWRMFTCIFIHSGPSHFIANTIGLIVAGRPIQRIFKTPIFLFLYILSGLAGGLLSLQFHPELVSVGASGAIFGIIGLGVIVTLSGNLPESMRNGKRKFLFMAFLLVAIISLGLTDPDPTFDRVAHIGGLAAGLAMGLTLARTLKQEPHSVSLRSQIPIVSAMAMVLVAPTFYLRHEYAYLRPLGIARSDFDGDRLDEAARNLQTVLKKHPNDPMANRYMGLIYSKKGDYALAETFLQSSIKAGGDNADLEYLLCQGYIREGRLAEAHWMLHKIIHEGYYGNDVRSLEADLLFADGKYVEAGQEYYMIHDYNNAIAALLRQLADKPNDLNALGTLVDAYAANGMWVEADQTRQKTHRVAAMIIPLRSIRVDQLTPVMQANCKTAFGNASARILLFMELRKADL
jgi:membrane associated rhomboid family serine protease